MARVAVVGVGAIGAAVAAAVQGAGGHELLLCARRRLEPVVVELPDGSAIELDAPLLTDPGSVDSPADWVLLAETPERLDRLNRYRTARRRPPRDDPGLPLWTDEYASLLRVLRRD